MRKLAGLALALVLQSCPALAASACRAESGDRVLPLVELYTSEGCDSCPAADRWLSAHFPPGGPTPAAVLAFHVDYWDRLGWKDRFASPAFTARQYQAMRANRATFVYTPQLVLQGRDFTAWRRGAPAKALASSATRPPRADIVLQAESDGGALRVDATARLKEAARGETLLALAYADSRVVSEVKAGENRGVTLTHDHVVRWFETRPVRAASGSFSVRVPRPGEAGTRSRVAKSYRRSCCRSLPAQPRPVGTARR